MHLWPFNLILGFWFFFCSVIEGFQLQSVLFRVWSATQESVSIKHKWGKALERICQEYKLTIIKKSVPKWSLLISFILVIPNLLLQVKFIVDCFWQYDLFDGRIRSSVKEIWAGAGASFQDKSIFICWIMVTIEALHCSPVWPDKADSGECEGAAHCIYRHLISVFIASITKCLHATFSDDNINAFGYNTCCGFSWDSTCGLMSIYTHTFINLRLFNQFGRYGCDWSLLTLCHQFCYYFFTISFLLSRCRTGSPGQTTFKWILHL